MNRFFLSLVIIIPGLFFFQSCNSKEIRKEYYKDAPSKIFVQTEVENNLKNGIESRFYKNGNISRVDHYKNDTLNGLRTIYREDGTISQMIPFISGKRQGSYRFFYKNGNVSESGTFINDYKRGKVFVYDEKDSGVVKMEVYAIFNKDDEFEYYRKQFDQNGNVISNRRNIHLEYENPKMVLGRKNTVKIYLDKFLGTYDSAVVIIGDFDSPDFHKSVKNAIKIPNDKEEIYYDFTPAKEGKGALRGAWIHYRKEILQDTLREYTNVGLFEDSIVVFRN